MLFEQTISQVPFKLWAIHDAENKKLLRFLVIVMVISFGWLKYMYPYPNFMPPDSYNYLESATNNDFINMWPIGYAKFLRLISVFTRSHMVLVICQYLLLLASVVYFLLSLRYLLSPGKWVFRIIFGVSIANPLLPHIANFISSDALFASLSLVWFTQLLWVIYQPTRLLLIQHAFIVLAAFTVRLTGIYYPLLSLAIISSAQMPAKTRWLGISAIAIFVLSFIGCTQYEYYKKTNKIQFSAFGGWQIASNALYGYAFAKQESIKIVPDKFKELHALVNRHMDSIRQIRIRPDQEPGVYYQWDFKSPLLLYLNKQVWPEEMPYFQRWAAMAPLYEEYGRWLISHYPVSFIKYYVWPNLKKYYAPPSNFMGYYIIGHSTVDPVAVQWFQLKNNLLTHRVKNAQIHTPSIITTLMSIINPAFIICAMFFMTFEGFRHCSSYNKRILSCMLILWLANMFFSVFSAPIELRYQIFPNLITVPFLILFISWLLRHLKTIPQPYSANAIAQSKSII